MAGRGGTSNSAQRAREQERAQRSNNSRTNATPRERPAPQRGPRHGQGPGRGGPVPSAPNPLAPSQQSFGPNVRAPNPLAPSQQSFDPSPRISPPPSAFPEPPPASPPRNPRSARAEVNQGGNRTVARGTPQSVSQRLRAELLAPRPAPNPSAPNPSAPNPSAPNPSAPNPSASRASRLARGPGRAGLIGAGIAGAAALYDYFNRPSRSETAPMDMTPDYGEGISPASTQPAAPTRPQAPRPQPQRRAAPAQEMTADRLNEISLALIQGRNPQPMNAAEAVAIERMRERMQGNGMATGGMMKAPKSAPVRTPNPIAQAKRTNAVRPPARPKVATPKPPSIKNMKTKVKGNK